MSGYRRFDAGVVGAGLHGCSTALHLARVGLRPLLLDKDAPGRHASGVNAGGVRRLGRDFAEIPLAQASLALWRELPELVGDDCGFQPCDQIKVAESDADLALLADRVERLGGLGYAHEVLIDAAELRRRVPGIAEHCPGGILCEGDGHALPFRTVTAFRRAAEAAGAELRRGAAASRLRRQDGIWRLEAGSEPVGAPLLFNCAGAWAGALAAQLGEPVPVRAEAPMLMITERVRPFLRPVLGCASRPLSFKQFDNGTLLIGGGHRGRADPERNLSELDFRALARNARTVLDLFPFLGRVKLVRCWGGIEAVTADGLPVVGASARHPGLYHAFGFSAHGFQLGPIVGQLLAELATGGHCSLSLQAFAIDRFAAGPGAERNHRQSLGS